MCPWASVEFDSMSPTSAMVGGVMGFPWGITVSWLTVPRVIPPKFQKMSCLSTVMCPLTYCINSTMLIAKG